MRQLNQNLAAVTGCWPTTRNEGRRGGRRSQRRRRRCAAASSPKTAKRSAPRPTSWRRSPTHLVDSLDDIKQMLHVAPDTRSRTSSTSTSRPGRADRRAGGEQLRQSDQFLCGAIQAASRLGAEQSAKLCVQYLAPIVKNRQFNFLPFGDEPVRRRAGPTQRGHLQRGLDAPRLHSAAPPPRTPPPATARRWPPTPAAPPSRRPVGDRSRRRAARHDGAAGRWLMTAASLARRVAVDRAAAVAGRAVRLRTGAA